MTHQNSPDDLGSKTLNGVDCSSVCGDFLSEPGDVCAPVPCPGDRVRRAGLVEPLTWGAETGLAVHREDIPPTTQLFLSAHTVQRKPEVNPQTGVRRVQRTSERGLVFRIDKEVSEVSMNQKSNKNTDKGFNRCFPKDDDSSESLGQQGDQTSQS